MFHMFDGLPMLVSYILFGPVETSIFSLGSDGKIFEWSLHNQSDSLIERLCSRYKAMKVDRGHLLIVHLLQGWICT
uniref:Uncharacterized protein n=1 Tax=Leersia perrieri TaxID=77586 RepID=A0A0D9XKI2_9ORYZ